MVTERKKIADYDRELHHFNVATTGVVVKILGGNPSVYQAARRSLLKNKNYWPKLARKIDRILVHPNGSVLELILKE